MLENASKSYTRCPNIDFNKYQAKPVTNNQAGILGIAPAEEVKAKWEDKLATLRAQRRAQGLCMKCGEKWGRNHKCSDKVSLHVLEEIMAIMPEDTSIASLSEESSEEEFFSLSQAAAVGIQGRKTIKLTGLINSQEILILIDSGSSSTFISEKAAATLQSHVTDAPPI